MSSAEPRLAEYFDFKLPPFPYPGLRPFAKHEWPIFFGRESMVDAVLDRLIDRQLVVVHGDSGCGKSSLVQAAVLPRLEQDHARGGVRWRTCAVRPGSAPLQHLAEALAGTTDEDLVTPIRRALNFGGAAAPEVAGKLGLDGTHHICLLIDQFEELFEFVRTNGLEDAILLVQFLVGLLQKRPQGLHVILTMRSEFLGVCAQFRGLAETVNETQYLLPRMSHDDLLRAIREPASLYGGCVAWDVAERLIADAGGGRDELPLIQHGLMLLCRPLFVPLEEAGSGSTALPMRPGTARWRFDLSHYDGTIGLKQLLSRHANEIADRLGEPVAIERLFRALIHINDEGHAIRRPQKLADLIEVTRTDGVTLTRIVDAFRADGVSFLQPYDHVPLEPATRIDISHEALIRCWDRIDDKQDGWLAHEFRDGLIWRSLLVQADSYERDPSRILADATAKEHAAWMKERNPAWARRYGDGWDRVENLVKRSLQAADEAEGERRRQLRSRNLSRAGIAVLGVLLVIALVFSYLQFQNRAATTASRLWDRLDFRTQMMEPDELNALWELVGAPSNVRDAFLRELESDPTRVAILEREPESVLRALYVQWPTELAERVLNAAARRGASAPAPPPSYINVARFPRIPLLDRLAERVSSSRRPAVLDGLVRRALKAKQQERNAFAAAALAIANTLTSEQAASLLTGSPFASFTTTEASDPVIAVYEAAARRVGPEHAPRVFAGVLPQLADTVDKSRAVPLVSVTLALSAAPTALELRGLIQTVEGEKAAGSRAEGRQEALKKLVAALDPSQAAQIGPMLLAAIEGTTETAKREAFSALLGALPAKTVVPRAHATLENMLKTAGSATARELQPALRVVAARISPEDAPDLVLQLSRAATLAEDTDRLRLLADLLQTVAARVSASGGANAFKTLFAATKLTSNPEHVSALVSGMRALPSGVTSTNAEAALGEVLTRWQGARDPALQQALEAALKAVAERLPEGERAAAAERLLAALARHATPGRRRGLMVALRSIDSRWPVDQSRRLYDRLLQLASTSPDAQLPSLVEVIQAMPPSLAPGQGEPALSSALRRVAQASDPNRRQTLVALFQEIAVRLPPAERTVITVVSARAIVSTKDRAVLSALVNSLSAVQPIDVTNASMPPPLGQELVQLVGTLTQTLAGATAGDQIESLSNAMPPLLGRFPSDHAAALLPILRQHRDTAPMPEAVAALDTAVHTTESLLPEAAAQLEFTGLVRTLENSTDPTAIQIIQTSLSTLVGRLSPERQAQALAMILRQSRRSRVSHHQQVAAAVLDAAALGATAPIGGEATAAPVFATIQSVAPLFRTVAQLLRDRSHAAASGAVTPPPAGHEDLVAVLETALGVLGGESVDVGPIVAPFDAKGRATNLELIVPALHAVAAKLNPGQRDVVLRELREILAWSPDSALAGDAAVLYGKLNSQQSSSDAIKAIADVLSFPTSENVTDILLEALYVKSDKKSPGPAAGLAANLRWVGAGAAPECPQPRDTTWFHCPR